ncbi:MAG: DNA-processing protein DprA [Candidatus Levybacteria bacterium]|nr:DNA-processing protein DprA [Candidatus Levybacteria bacterium]
MSNEGKFYLGFSNFPGVGPIKFEKLLKYFGSAELAWKSDPKEFGEVAGKSLISKFETFRKEFDIEKYEEGLVKQKINFVCLHEKEYPTRLKKIKNPPIVLYSKGKVDFNLEQKLLAVVGTRKITNYGRSITEMFASELASQGLIIVSGLAIGVDGVAHTASLDSHGITIAVLGNGVDICFPRENQKIYDRILGGNGAIISEYPPGQEPSVGSFPARNRIVAGLSDGILVTEGASDSGSLITANFGLEFGRKVFAVPGPITSSLSAAPLRLIEKGAKLVVGPEDIIKELGIKPSELPKNKKTFAGLTNEEKKIIELVENESLQFDEIVRRLKLDSSKVGTILSMMEIKGLIKNLGGNYSVISLF